MNARENNQSALRQTMQHIKSMPGLAVCFILIFSVVYLLPMLYSFFMKTGQPPIGWLFFANMIAGLIISIVILPYVSAGFYGQIFCRMEKQNYPQGFFKHARQNFKQFFLINLFLLGLKLVFHIIPFSLLPIFFGASEHFLQINRIFSYYVSGVEFIFALLFLFAYPLATLGYFSQQKLRPIATSPKVVAKHIVKIWPLVILLAIQYFYSIGLRLIVDSRYISIPNSLISSSLEFVMIVMSFVYLSKTLFSGLEFNFSTD